MVKKDGLDQIVSCLFLFVPASPLSPDFVPNSLKKFQWNVQTEVVLILFLKQCRKWPETAQSGKDRIESNEIKRFRVSCQLRFRLAGGFDVEGGEVNGN